MPVDLTVVSMSKAYVFTNCAYVSPADFSTLSSEASGIAGVPTSAEDLKGYDGLLAPCQRRPPRLRINVAAGIDAVTVVCSPAHD